MPRNQKITTSGMELVRDISGTWKQSLPVEDGTRARGDGEDLKELGMQIFELTQQLQARMP